jgi:hypothetical protein
VSDKVFEKVSFGGTFKVRDEFIKTVMSYAIPHAVSDLGSYWRSEDAEKIISDTTFGFVWENYPETREELLGVALNITHNNTRARSLTEDFCKKFLSDVYSLIEDNEDEEDNGLRIRLLPSIDRGFDYLSQMCKFSLEEEKMKLYNMWRRAGLSSSKDPSFYDYVWSKVKREKGSVDIKLNILDSAFENSSVSDALLKRIAKSSPKNVKRMTTDRVSRMIRDEKYRVKKYERENTTDSLKLAAFLQKQVDEMERKIMMFVDCTDREVVSNLLDSLSKDNLPWLMPAASNHYYLSRRLEGMIESDE